MNGVEDICAKVQELTGFRVYIAEGNIYLNRAKGV